MLLFFYSLSDYSHVVVVVMPPTVIEVFISAQPPIASISTTISSTPFVSVTQVQVFLQEANEATKATTANVKNTFFMIN